MKQNNNIYLRLVQESDAEFILSLRLNPKLNKFLSPVSNNVESQVKWIKEYKSAETLGINYYFIIEDKQMGPVGMLRVYDINYLDLSCEWGSWVVSENRPSYAALASMLLVYEFIFNELNLKLCRFRVDKANLKTINFHLRFGSKLIYETQDEVFFELSKTLYTQIKYSKYYSHI